MMTAGLCFSGTASSISLLSLITFKKVSVRVWSSRKIEILRVPGKKLPRQWRHQVECDGEMRILFGGFSVVHVLRLGDVGALARHTDIESMLKIS